VTDVAASLREHAATLPEEDECGECGGFFETCSCEEGYRVCTQPAMTIQQEAATYLSEIERWFDENGDEI
jgi:hypothetical protein